MIEFVRGNILTSSADFIVVPVNCIGKLGAGLAKEWAENAPEDVIKYYIRTCLSGNLAPGNILHFTDSTYILAATKDHWARPSEYEWIDTIATNLRDLVIAQKWWKENARTIAVPKLGCGWGRLRWALVREILVHHLEQSPALFYIYGS